MGCEARVNWLDVFNKVGAVWRFDKEKKDLTKSFALLTSDNIADTYVNCDIIFQNPSLTQRAVGHLMHDRVLGDAIADAGTGRIYREDVALNATTLSDRPMVHVEQRGKRFDRVVGVANGGVLMSHSIALHEGVRCGYAVKNKDGSLALERCGIRDGEVLLFAEDVSTTGGTVLKFRDQIRKRYPDVKILKCVLMFCNGSNGTHLDDMEIASLFTLEYGIWRRGRNPYTLDGREQVEPLAPKLNWDKFVPQTA